MKILTLHAILATFLSLVAASPIERVPGKYRGLITGRAHRTDVRRILGRPEWIGQPEGAEDGPVAGRLQYSYKVGDGRWEWLRVVMRARTGCVDEIVLETRDDVPITLTEALQAAGLSDSMPRRQGDSDYHYTDPYGRLVYPRLGVTLYVAQGNQVVAMVFSATRP